MQDPDVALYWAPTGLSCWRFVWWRQFPFVMLNVIGTLYWISPRLANSHRLRAVVLYPLPKVLTELVARFTGGGKPLNEDLTALRHSW
jgi:hypothetical protein